MVQTPLTALPSPNAPTNLKTDNIQGDILIGVPKKVEKYAFLQIQNVDQFRKSLTQLIPLVTTTKDLQDIRAKIEKAKKDAAREHRPCPLLPVVGVTVGFSTFGLTKLKQNLNDLGNEPEFKSGMKLDAAALGDPTSPTDPTDPKWIDVYKQKIDFVLDVAGDSWNTVNQQWKKIEGIFGIGTNHSTVTVIHTVDGNVRPGDQEGHEHFGFMDGISQPAIKGFGDAPLPGQHVIDAKFALLGHDPAAPAASWLVDGSFLAFRQLEQLVPEFNDFVNKHPIAIPGLSPEKGSELLGARLMGRWKSGAPVDVTPTHDDIALAKDPQRNNLFDYSTDFTQTRCPYSAHVRKTNPRTDLASFGPIDNRMMFRRGIPYGPEVTQEEEHGAKSKESRGLAFACYNVSIKGGFKFVQSTWANRTDFPPLKNVNPGFDPITGLGGGLPRNLIGTNPEQPDKSLTLPVDFVVTKGGEYFFVPSIACLRDVFATGQHGRA